MKKILAALLAVVMMLSMASAVFAEDQAFLQRYFVTGMALGSVKG